MTGSGTPSAATITVRQTLALLDGEHRGLADGVANGRYAFWLGSGISRSRVPDLHILVEKVLEFLRASISPSNSDCRYRAALDQAISLAEPSTEERSQIDYGQPVASWPSHKALAQRLVKGYSELLNIEVDGEPGDCLLWEGVNVRTTYPADAEPDCEHLCLAILCLEGVVPDAVSANWDGLIEAAIRELHGDPADVLKVVVLADDTRLPDRRTRLLKFHGCAVLAAQDEHKYRSALVGSEDQITHWSTAHEHKTMRDTLQALAAAKPTFVIGLSAQDHNIQLVFAGAEEQLPWGWPSDPPPPAMFAADELGEKHRALLKSIYRDSFTQHATAIKRAALIRAYAAQVLCALVLYSLTAKLEAYLACTDTPNLNGADRAQLAAGLRVLRDIASSVADGNRLDYIRSLVRREGHALSLFRRGEEPAPSGRYQPLGHAPVDRIGTDETESTSGLPELAGALAVIGTEVAEHGWQLSFTATNAGHDGVLQVAPDGRPKSAVYISASPRAAARLPATGVFGAAGDVVIIHCTGLADTPTRSPAGRYGRTGRRTARNVDMAELLRTSRDIEELRSRFRQAAAL